MAFDVERAKLSGPDYFPRFRVQGPGVPLASSGLTPREHVLVVDRPGGRLALSLAQMTFHHVAQGEIAGEPYLVAF